MKRASGLAVVAGCIALAATGAFAGNINCAQVNKYLQTGRTPQDIAETMVIPVDEVKKCQSESQGGQAPAGGGTRQLGTAPAGGAADPGQKK